MPLPDLLHATINVLAGLAVGVATITLYLRRARSAHWWKAAREALAAAREGHTDG